MKKWIREGKECNLWRWVWMVFSKDLKEEKKAIIQILNKRTKRMEHTIVDYNSTSEPIKM